jgi:hypothetical protein
MNKKLIIGCASILIGVIILNNDLVALKPVMGSLRSGISEVSSLIAGIIFIAVILFASYVILKGNEHLKKQIRFSNFII